MSRLALLVAIFLASFLPRMYRPKTAVHPGKVEIRFQKIRIFYNFVSDQILSVSKRNVHPRSDPFFCQKKNGWLFSFVTPRGVDLSKNYHENP